MTWSAKHVSVVVGTPETVGEFVGATDGRSLGATDTVGAFDGATDGRSDGADVVGARVGGQLLLSLLSRMVVSELRHPPLMVSPLFTRAPSSFSV